LAATTVNFLAAWSSRSGKVALVEKIASYDEFPLVMKAHLVMIKSVTRCLRLGVEDALLDLERGAEVLDQNIAPCALAKAEGTTS
jgi:hypothetical protein